MDALPDTSQRLRSRHGGGEHACAKKSDRTAGTGYRYDEAGGDPPGRGNQPLVPCYRDEPRLLSPPDANRQHRPAWRRLPHLGWKLQGGALPGFSLDWTRLQGLGRSEEHTSELQSQSNLVCRLLLEKK